MPRVEKNHYRVSGVSIKATLFFFSSYPNSISYCLLKKILPLCKANGTLMEVNCIENAETRPVSPTAECTHILWPSNSTPSYIPNGNTYAYPQMTCK